MLARVFDRRMGHPIKSMSAHRAGVVELADAPDSKSGGGNPVGVRFSPPAPKSLSVDICDTFDSCVGWPTITGAMLMSGCNAAS